MRLLDFGPCLNVHKLEFGSFLFVFKYGKIIQISRCPSVSGEYLIKLVHKYYILPYLVTRCK